MWRKKTKNFSADAKKRNICDYVRRRDNLLWKNYIIMFLLCQYFTEKNFLLSLISRLIRGKRTSAKILKVSDIYSSCCFRSVLSENYILHRFRCAINWFERSFVHQNSTVYDNPRQFSTSMPAIGKICGEKPLRSWDNIFMRKENPPFSASFTLNQIWSRIFVSFSIRVVRANRSRLAGRFWCLGRLCV